MPRHAPPARADCLFPSGTGRPEMVQLAAVIGHPNWDVGRDNANDFEPPNSAKTVSPAVCDAS